MSPKNFQQRSSSLLFATFLVFLMPFVSGQVSTWEGTITIPTYGWQEDVNPKFWAMEAGAKGSTTVKASITYPYNMQDHLSRKLEDRTYQALFLENEFLKITCLPELGGRLHSVFDKTTKQEVFHLNNVIKPSMIAMRGAFISGGIEWNFGPQVHTVTILSPVNAILGTNDDGSAFIEISNLEKSLRTRWTVRVTLHPGKAYLDEKIRIYNPTDAMNPYYFWNCTAFPQLPGTRFIYPMSLGTDHYGLEYFNWPIHKGKDLSWTKNYEDASSIFSVDCPFDFFGAYDVDLDRGIVMVANHHEHSGKKAWTWGQGEYGRVSMQNLTDTDGNYIEVQSGPLPTQSDYGVLAPRSEISWQEYWFPVHGLGDGFEYANKKVTFQVNRDENNLEIRVITTEAFKAARYRIYSGKSLLYEKKLDLSPLTAVVTNVEDPGSPVSVRLETSEAELIAEFTTPLPIPEVIPADPPSYLGKSDDKLTLEEIYLTGQKYDRSLNRLEARKYYNLGLKRDSLHLATLRDLGIIDFEAGLYESAAIKFKQALNQRPNDDGLSWYFLGICNLNQENLYEALNCGFKASRCIGTTSLGFDIIGRSYMLSGNGTEALRYFEKASKINMSDDKAFHHYLIALFATGGFDHAAILATGWVSEHPTDLVSRAILALMQDDLSRFSMETRNFLGEDDFELLEASLAFSELGLYREAASILDASCIQPMNEDKVNPMVLYYMAYLSSMQGDQEKASTFLSMASGSYQDFILASRHESIEVLNYAIQNNADDAHALYQLGNLMGNFGRLEEATVYWSQAVAKDPGLSVAWRNLGLHAWVSKNDYTGAEYYYRQAIKARPADQTLYRDLARLLTDKGSDDEAIAVLEKMPVNGVRRSDVIINLAQSYLVTGRYDDCLDLLKSTPYFVNWEGSSITWEIFNKACIEKGILDFNKKKYGKALNGFEMALTFPENLGVGRSSRTEEAMAWYWKGKTLEELGRKKEAKDSWIKGKNTPGGSDKQEKYRNMCSKILE